MLPGIDPFFSSPINSELAENRPQLLDRRSRSKQHHHRFDENPTFLNVLIFHGKPSSS
jgi:hypothetical protein